MRARAVAVVVDGGDVLVIARSKNGEDYLVLPGGGIHQGESPAEGCLRELREETGLRGEVIRDLPVSTSLGEAIFYFEVSVRSRDLHLGGPESRRNTSTNSYEPMWARAGAVEGLVPASAQQAVRVAQSGR